MADNVFDRTNTGLRERPVSGDLNQSGSQWHRTICEILRVMFSSRTSNTASAMAATTGFMGDGFRAVPSGPAAMSVVVSAGMGFVYDGTDLPTDIGAADLEQVDDLSPFKPLPLTVPVTFAVPAAPSAPNSRIDIIEVRADRRLENSVVRKQLNTGTLDFDDHAFFKTLAFALDGRTGIVTSPAASTAGLSYKIGTAANPGLVPAVTAGYVKIAEIRVPNGTTTITGSAIVDRRTLLGPGGVLRASARVRVQNTGAPPMVVTLISVDAPPGVEIGIGQLSGGGEKGNFLMYMIAGAFTRLVRQVTVEALAIGSVNAGQSIAFTMSEANQPIVTIDSTFQAEAATAGIAVGIGQVAARIESNGQTVYRDNTGAGSTASAKLDNLLFNVSFDIAYD